MGSDETEEKRLRAAALRNAESIRIARHRAERELLATKEALERKTEELQQQRAWFEITLSSIGDAVITTDVQGNVTYLNPVAESMTGWTSAQATGEPLERVFRIINEYTRQIVENPVSKVLQSGKILGLANHTALINRSGRVIPIEDSAAPIRDAHGKIAGAVMVFHDVSDRRRAEVALRASSERLRATFNQVAVGIVVADLNRQFLDANQRSCDLLGYSLDELRQLTFTDITHPEDLSETQAQARALLAGEIPHCALEKRYVRKDGATVWSRTTVTLQKEDVTGEAYQFIGIIEDITDRKRTEQALRDAQAQAHEIRSGLAAIVESSDDAIISKTLDGVISTWNHGAERMFGYAAHEVIGKPVTLLIPPNHIDEEPAILHRLRRGERVDHYETVRLTKDGTLLDVSLTVSPIRDISGTIIGASKIARDITQRKRAEEALRNEIAIRERAEAALRDADRRKDEFLATLAHELRNPLAPIRQAALISRAPTATEAQKRWSSEVISRQVHHMALLLDDLLDISRITRGTLELRTEMIELAAVVHAAIEAARPTIDAKRHRFSIELPPEPVHFVADPLRLAQVLSNLLTNAAKYTDREGELRLSVSCAAETITISVVDTGVGIPPDAITNLFEMFSQVASSRDRSEGGLGIGLALAKGLIQLHGGEIEARSAGLGHGSEFIVRLPLRRTSVLPQRQTRASTPARPVSRRVLIADDNRDAAESLAVLLRMDGHDVTVVHNGKKALAAFSAVQPEVALLDIGMPELNGYEVARQVRQDCLGQAVTLIALTGWGQDKDKAQALAAGFNHHFTKPVEADGLRELLRSESLDN
ncbi:MAG: chemotaxis protein methyltransferase CheR [Gammaproteobacteria bacterium]|nr:chemotaxis protein methyltransferase CheR [Gammaproteobacteria bacterium]